MKKEIVSSTPVMKQYMDIKSKYEKEIVLFRMGDFYETFLDDAKLVSDILGIVLTKRSNGKAANVALAGFPFHALDNYLPKLVESGYCVAICEQTEDPKLAKGIVKREVVEVVTPGTLVSDNYLKEKSNHFISAIAFKKGKVGFSILDASTGEFFLGESKSDNVEECLLQFSPREIVLSEDVTYSLSDWYRSINPFVTKIDKWIFDFDLCYKTMIKHFKVHSLKGFGCEPYPLGISAAGALMYHVQQNLNLSLDHISTIIPVKNDDIMGLDNFTIKNLEIFTSLATQGNHGTLIETLDNTLTPGGGRLLRKWVRRPLVNKKKINDRLDLVKGLTERISLIESVRESLHYVIDIERILGKINKSKVSPPELIGLARVLNKIPNWKETLLNSKYPALEKFSELFVNTREVVDEILNKINEDAPNKITNGEIIKSGIDRELDELRNLLKSGKSWISNFQESKKVELNIPSLKVKFNKVFGYFIEVTKTHLDKVPQSFNRKQTLVNSERYFTDELKEYEEKVLSAQSKILDIENRIFWQLNNYILSKSKHIYINSNLINKLDLLSSFAEKAIKENYVRPTLSNKPILEIIKGRHPVVEKLLPNTEKFIPNDLKLNRENNQIHLITGPNMAGKSTYLRQVGLIVLMSQIGSFVPANLAKIGIVDRLFTRVGASDNLAGGESTFMVEMNEAANILNNATGKSLILLDEIGRGTATFDGLSIAWAITEYIHDTPSVNARTLFATHYHELTELSNKLDRLKNYHVEIKEHGDQIVFLRSISKGPVDKSYGIQVAQMAGLPKSIIRRAKEILMKNISNSSNEKSFDSNRLKNDHQETEKDIEKKLKQDIMDMDLERMSPIQVMNNLDEIKKKYNI